MTSIRSYAFSGCTGLASVAIPDSVTNAFKDLLRIIYNGPVQLKNKLGTTRRNRK